jgi:hypothetical protein
MKLGFFITLLNQSHSHCMTVTVMMWFKGQAAVFYDSGIQELVPRLNICLNNAGDYVEK